MKALTLRQPYASLVVCGAKRFETRSWATSYRGTLLIHAAKAPVDWAAVPLLADRAAPALAAAGLATLPFGCIIGAVTVVDCVHVEQVAPSTQEAAFGDFTAGRYAWLLAEPRPLARPIPWRGALGLWTYTGSFMEHERGFSSCRPPGIDRCRSAQQNAAGE